MHTGFGSSGREHYPRPYAYFHPQVFQFNAFSNYSAGTITVRKRFEHGLLFRANYTWAKNLDMNSALNYAGNGGYPGRPEYVQPEGRIRPGGRRPPHGIQRQLRLCDSVQP